MAILRNDINFLELINLVKNNVQAALNCHNIGKIVEFNATKQTCTVQMMQVKQFNNNYYDPAPITDVPLIIYGAGGGHITLPNPVGTYCLLFFMDRNIDSFLETGEQYVPETTRMHDFTDCIAITTFKTLVNPIDNYDELAVSILNEKIIEEIPYNSFIKVYPDKIQMEVSQTSEDNPQQAKINIDDEIHLEADKGAVVKLSDKILLKNNLYNFMNLLDELITEYILPLYPADPEKSNLEALLANFKLLLEETPQENT